MGDRCGVAIVGCGYVAHFYARNIRHYPSLHLKGGFDVDRQQADRFGAYFQIPVYPSLEAVLEDKSVALVLNLTNPRSHFAVSEACLRAGKHVYSEKPLAMTPEMGSELLALAGRLGLRLSCAPCSVLSDTAQTLWKAIHDDAIGRVRLVYANYDDGMIAPQQRPWTWRVESGAHWPARDEFEVGCTYEHAGYFLTWLGAFFGPAKRVHAYANCILPDKGIDVERMAPDFSVGCIEYEAGVVARVTCGLVAPRDKSLTVVGDKGVLYVRYLRNDREPVYLRKYQLSRNESRIENRLNQVKDKFRRQLEHLPWPIHEVMLHERYPPARNTGMEAAGVGKPVDFMRGPMELVEAIREGRPHRLSAEFAVHIVELVQALQHPPASGAIQEMKSRFDPIPPLPWG